MQITVDVSLYPLMDKYIPAIDDFIEKADANEDIRVAKNTLSTQLCGDISVIMPFLENAFKASWETYGQGVFVTKFLSGDLIPEEIGSR